MSQRKQRKSSPDLYYEKSLKLKGYNLIIGVDEAGRGPLAGPVVAAAVALSAKTRFKNRVDDSKKLSPAQREKVFPEIINSCAYGIGIIEEGMIDYFNIFCASRLAMEQAIFALIDKLGRVSAKEAHILVDGNMKLNIDLPFTSIIRGDAKSKSIACASIVAKVTRDRIMNLYDNVYPQYGFKRHKGYPTRTHRIAIKEFGPSLIHRKTFQSCLADI